MNNTLELQSIIIDIPKIAYKLANDFAIVQKNPNIAKQVYLNTLAVYTLDGFLKLMGIETDLESSFSWQPLPIELDYIADLCLPKIGRLECIIVESEQTEIELNNELLEDRLGYVFVNFNDNLEQLTILGFLPEFLNDETEDDIIINLQEISPIDELFNQINRIDRGLKDSRFPDSLAREFLILKLERMFRTKEEFELLFEIENLLRENQNYFAIKEENPLENEDDQLINLAMNLKQWLKEIWG